MKPIGKLTAPTRMEGLSSFDMFKSNQQEEVPNNRRNHKVEIEETKITIRNTRSR